MKNIFLVFLVQTVFCFLIIVPVKKNPFSKKKNSKKTKKKDSCDWTQ